MCSSVHLANVICCNNMLMLKKLAKICKSFCNILCYFMCERRGHRTVSEVPCRGDWSWSVQNRKMRCEYENCVYCEAVSRRHT